MPRLPYVATGVRSTRHLISGFARVYREDRAYGEPAPIRVHGETCCSMGFTDELLEVGDTERGDAWCRICIRRVHRSATCAHSALAALGRSPEEVWAAMVREIASAVDRLAPMRARVILAELLRRAPIGEGFGGRNVENELGEVWRDTVADFTGPLADRLQQLEGNDT